MWETAVVRWNSVHRRTNRSNEKEDPKLNRINSSWPRRSLRRQTPTSRADILSNQGSHTEASAIKHSVRGNMQRMRGHLRGDDETTNRHSSVWTWCTEEHVRSKNKTTTSMVSSQSLSNNKHALRETQQPRRRRNNNNKSLPYDDLLGNEIGQQDWPPLWSTQTTIDKAITRRRRKNERRTSTAPQRSPNTKKHTVTTWTGRTFVSCGVTTSSTAFWSRSRWSLERMNLDSIGPPIRYLSWSFQKAWNDTWFLIRMDKLARLFSRSLYQTSRTKRGAKERRRRRTMTTTTTEGEAVHACFDSRRQPSSETRLNMRHHPNRGFSSAWSSLSLSSSSSSAWVTVCVFSRVFFCLCRLSLSLFPCVSNWLSLCVALLISLFLSLQLGWTSLVGVRFVLFVHLCCNFSW